MGGVSNKPTILFLFNHSLYAPQPWIDDGRFNCVSVDYDDTDHSGYHDSKKHSGLLRINLDLRDSKSLLAIGSILNALEFQQASLIISFPPCTDLAVSGAAHFKKKAEADPDFQKKAVVAARLAADWSSAPYCIENPVSRLSTLWRKPDHKFHPYEYAGYCPKGKHPEFPDIIPTQDRYKKQTCIWSGNGFVMPEKKPIAPIDSVNPGHKKLGGKSARTKYIRSLTPRGFANAVYMANHSKLLVN